MSERAIDATAIVGAARNLDFGFVRPHGTVQVILVLVGQVITKIQGIDHCNSQRADPAQQLRYAGWNQILNPSDALQS